METLAGLTVENYVFEEARSFKYLKVTIAGNNNWNAEILSRFLKTERAFFALIKYFNQQYSLEEQKYANTFLLDLH